MLNLPLKRKKKIYFFESSSRDELFFMPAVYIALRSYIEQNSSFADMFEWSFITTSFERDLDKIIEDIKEIDLFCISSYCWSEKQGLYLANKLKNKFAHVKVIFGGPQVPTQKEDVLSYLAKYRFIDFLVHGEGEQKFLELLEATLQEAEWEVIKNLKGISYVNGKDIFYQKDGAQRSNLALSKKSPYEMEFYQNLLKVCRSKKKEIRVIWETNRGCPYSCAFCNWGSLTESKLTRYSYDKLMQEVNLFFEDQIDALYISDANFGILKRDLSLIESIAELQLKNRSLRQISMNTAKNVNAQVLEICKILTSLNLKIPYGITLSFQAVTEKVVQNISRGNIDIMKLKIEMEKKNLSFRHSYSEFIVALPGETFETWLNTLDFIHEQKLVNIVFYPFQLLKNTPAYDKNYQKRYGFVVKELEYPRSFEVQFGKKIDHEKWKIVLATKDLPLEESKLVFLLNEFFISIKKVEVIEQAIVKKAELEQVSFSKILLRLLMHLIDGKGNCASCLKRVKFEIEQSLFFGEIAYTRELTVGSTRQSFTNFLVDNIKSNSLSILLAMRNI